MEEQKELRRDITRPKKERASNMEMLRIVAMVGIVFFHIATHGSLLEYSSFSENSVFVEWLQLGGSIGNNLFILISGFFLIHSTFSFKKVFKLFLQVSFYSVILYVAACFLNTADFSLKKLAQSFLPFLSGGGYWFIVTYMLVYFLSPLLNKGIISLKRNQLILLIGFFGFLYIFVPSIIHQVISVNDFGFNKFVWFIYIYAIGAYFRLYVETGKYKKHAVIALAAVSVLMLGMQVIRNYETIVVGQRSLFSNILAARGLNNILPVGFSCVLFYVFLHIDLGCKKWINIGGSTVFGIYLIHDHPVFKDFIWQSLFKVSQFQYATYFPIICVLVVATIMVCCGCIDYGRQKLLEAPLLKSKRVNTFCDKLNDWNLENWRRNACTK